MWTNDNHSARLMGVPLYGELSVTLITHRFGTNLMPSNLSRRDFHKLTSAALGGMLTGAVAGCSSDKKAPDAGAKDDAAGKNGGGDAAMVAVAIHACRGLNECKGQGLDGKNSCAGQGTCHTAKAHDCATMNDCK